MPKSKQQTIKEAARRGLVSVMNDTKWRELQNAVRGDLPFAPPYQLKVLFNPDAEPGHFDTDVDYLGVWTDECLFPFYEIEWIRVRPRFLYRSIWKRTEAPELRSVEHEFLAILHRHNIPYQRDSGSIWIFGYAASTGDVKLGSELRKRI
jgi:hypothetical protein